MLTLGPTNRSGEHSLTRGPEDTVCNDEAGGFDADAAGLP